MSGAISNTLVPDCGLVIMGVSPCWVAAGCVTETPNVTLPVHVRRRYPLPMGNRPDDQHDAELARRIAEAAPGMAREAEAELYRRLAPRVRLYGLRHLRDEQAAADLAQQVLLMTIEKLRAGELR